MSLTGWQSIAALAIAAALGVVGVLVPNGGPLVSVATAMVTGVFTLLQPRRDPGSRGRSSDRIPTAAQGVPLLPYDRHKTPRADQQPQPPDPATRRRP